ncbi:DUF805 domain-containing protein [Enterobacter soli]|uniref:DUF805 domain-containing protein n=1 Tax=Enterobacter soli TaxID=885040 RepID=UPI0034CF372B
MNWYFEVLRNYVVFAGRARRKEYWMFTLVSSIISIVFIFADLMLGLGEFAGGILFTIYSLLVMLPTVAVTFRRLHDTERSAWWLLLGLIPLVGSLVLLVFMCSDGTPGDNRFGPDPKRNA